MLPSVSATTGTPKLSSPTEKKAWKTAQEFEQIFLRQIVQSLRKTAQVEGEASASGDLMAGMAWDGLADAMGKAGGFGLAREIYPVLLRQPGEANAPAPLPAADIPPMAVAPTPDRVRQAYRNASKGNIETWLQEASRATGVDASLLRGVMKAESGGNPEAVSPVGALGLMQLMPGTAKELGVDPRDPRQNLMGGARYLASLLRRFEGDERLALAGYNAGPGAVERHGGIPPYPETRTYVRRVLEHRDRDRAQNQEATP